MAGFHRPAEAVGSGEDVLVARSEPQTEQGLREADGHERGVCLRGYDPPDGKAVGPLMRLFGRFLRAPVIAVEPSNGSRSARRTLENLSPTLQRAPGPSPRSAPLGCAPQLAAGAP